MAAFDYDVGVIGGGAAGLTMASGAAQLGASVVLLEKEPHLGGDCLHYGCVPSKTLIKSAGVYHQIKNSAAFGLPRLDPPPVDFARIRARIAKVIATIQTHDSEQRFCDLGVKVRFGRPRFADEHSVEVDGGRVSARAWLIATGSSAALPPIPGLADNPHLTNRDLFSLERLPESLIVLGAGPIAIEMAQAFRRLGSRVAVVQRGGGILSREDKDMADAVMARLQAEGVEFHLNVKISRVSQANGRARVALADADGRGHELEAERLLVALGRTANLDGLGLEGIGVAYDARGLKLDSRLRTAHKHIYGAGDVTGAYQFTHAAGYEGGVALANAVLRLPRKADYTWMPRVTFCAPELAAMGLGEAQARAQGLRYSVWTENLADNDRALAEGEPGGKLKLILDQDEKLLGVQILGLHAGELLNEWVAVAGGKVKLSTLAGAVHPYPTLGEINKRVAGDVMSPKLFSAVVKKGLKILFHTKGRACTPPRDA